jgi:hypothetical protein
MKSDLVWFSFGTKRRTRPLETIMFAQSATPTVRRFDKFSRRLRRALLELVGFDYLLTSDAFATCAEADAPNLLNQFGTDTSPAAV